MKKSLVLLLAPALLVLTSCEFRQNFYSSGLDKSMSNSGNSAISYEYYSGDDLETEGLSVARFTFSVSKTASNISKEDLVSVISCDNASVEYEIQDAQYVGSKVDTGLFIGLDSTYADGFLTLSLNKSVKSVSVKANRYYYESNSFETSMFVDSDVAIAVNNSRYIKLTGEKNDSGVPNETECRYSLGEGTNQITVKVGSQRAFIKEIVCYF